MRMDIVKYACMLWIMNRTTEAGNLLQSNLGLSHNSEIPGQAVRDPSPSIPYEHSYTSHRQLLEDVKDDEELKSGIQPNKDYVVDISEQGDSFKLPLKGKRVNLQLMEDDENEDYKKGVSSSESKQEGTIPRIVQSTPQRASREVKQVENENELFHIHKLFDKFGDGETMTYEGFERLLKSLGLQRLVSNGTKEHNMTNYSTTNEAHTLNNNSSIIISTLKDIKNNASQDDLKCLKSRDFFSNFITLRKPSEDAPESSGGLSLGGLRQRGEGALLKICPSLLYQLTSATVREQEEGCFLISDVSETKKLQGVKPEMNMGQVWLFASLSVIGVSVCGMLGITMIPIMHHKFYQELLHFLVAMAIGTLCGDALLHLLPEAMEPIKTKGLTRLEGDQQSEELNVKRGFVAAFGIVLFFFFERCMLRGSRWLKRRQRKRKTRKNMIISSFERISHQEENPGKPKTIVFPYNYEEIPSEVSVNEKNVALDNSHLVESGTIVKMASEQEKQINILAEENEMKVLNETHELKELESESHSLREDDSDIHGHPHSHAVIHLANESISTIAYMVMMGDMLDNMTDGAAIGAAFAASTAGGFSTVIAVFFHELPHELGDFAVLLKSGMSIKAVIIYNLMSSSLCLFGMIGGVLLGQDEEMLKWVFSVAAGLFLYVALVDMIPELTGGHSSEDGTILQLILQFLGLLTGLGVMLLIASLEEQLESLFVN